MRGWRVQWYAKDQYVPKGEKPYDKFIPALKFAVQVKHRTGIKSVKIFRIPDMTLYWRDGQFL